MDYLGGLIRTGAHRDVRRYAIGAAKLPDRLSFATPAGAITIDLPDLPSFSPSQLPSVGAYKDLLGKAASGASLGIADAVAAAAALAPPPYGTAIAAGMQALSFVGGLFGSSEPPPPNVKGMPREGLIKAPLGDSSVAAVAGRIIGGRIEVEGPLREAISIKALPGVNFAVNAMATKFRTKPLVEGGDLDRQLQRDYGTSLRAVAYFVSYAGYDAVFNSEYVDGDAQQAQVGRLFAWAAPRVQLRELLMYVYAALTIHLAPKFRADMFTESSRDMVSRGRAFYDIMGSDEGWWSLAKARAVPAPDRNDETDLWVYAPISKEVLASEVPLYEAKTWDAARLKIVDTVANYNVHRFWLPSVGVSFAQAVALAYQVAARDRNWMDTVRRKLDQMGAESKSEANARGRAAARAMLDRAKQRKQEPTQKAAAVADPKQKGSVFSRIAERTKAAAVAERDAKAKTGGAAKAIGALGGAGIGFAIAGPIGGLVGAVAGYLAGQMGA